jgi:hypothetical protein
VLLLALLVPGAHAQAHALPVVAGALGEVAEHDVLDRRSAVRPARSGTDPQPKPARCVRAGPTPAEPPRPPYLTHVLRTVVLRC